MLGIVLGAGYTAVNKIDDIFTLMELILVSEC